MKSYRRTSVRRSAVTALLVAVALICGPLAAAPAHAATSSVDGVVRDSSGGLDGALISVWELDTGDGEYYYDESLDAETDSTGHYALDLEPGTYKLLFEGDAQHSWEFYDDQLTFDAATPVVVDDGDQTLDDVELGPAAPISGTIKADGGAKAPAAYAVAYLLQGGAWIPLDYADVDPNGSYSLPLPFGTYRIGFFDDNDVFVPEYWNDAETLEQGTSIALGAGGYAGVDAQLRRASDPLPAYTNVKRPAITAFAVVGQTIQVADEGRWSPAPATTTRQWLRDGAPIPGATGVQYKITRADFGARLSVQVTASGPKHRPTVVTSPPSDTVKWTSRTTAKSKAGKKKATITIKVTSAGGNPTGKVVVKLRDKVVKTVTLKRGKATITLRKPKKKAYTVYYLGSNATVGSRVDVRVRAK